MGADSAPSMPEPDIPNPEEPKPPKSRLKRLLAGRSDEMDNGSTDYRAAFYIVRAFGYSFLSDAGRRTRLDSFGTSFYRTHCRGSVIAVAARKCLFLLKTSWPDAKNPG